MDTWALFYFVLSEGFIACETPDLEVAFALGEGKKAFVTVGDHWWQSTKCKLFWSSGRRRDTFLLSPLCKIPSQLKGKTFRVTCVRIDGLPGGPWRWYHHHKSEKCWRRWLSPSGSFSWICVLLLACWEVLATCITGTLLSVDLTIHCVWITLPLCQLTPNGTFKQGLWLSYLSFCLEWLEQGHGTMVGIYAEFWMMAFQGLGAK